MAQAHVVDAERRNGAHAQHISTPGHYGSVNADMPPRRPEGNGHHEKATADTQMTNVGHGTAMQLGEFRKKKRLAVFIVTLTLFLDYCLMTVLVPIAPAYLGIKANDSGGFSKLGILFASNSGVQLIANIFLGPIVDRFGSSSPLFAGVMAMAMSSIIFAFAGDISWTHRYEIVVAARAMQGISSACAATGGLAWLATLFSTDEERGEAIGTAMGGLGLGVLLGPPLGAAFTKLGVEPGWKYPFLILAFLCILDAFLQMLLVWFPLPTYHSQSEQSDGNAQRGYMHKVWQLATDPYVVLTFTLSFFSNSVMGVLEASFPLVITEIFSAKGWVLGVIFIPAMLSYTVATPLSGKYLGKIGRQWGLLIGGFCLVIGMFSMPFVATTLAQHHQSVWYMSASLALCGAGLGIMDPSVMLYMADIVQRRHSSLFGTSCAIVDASVSLAFFLGPLCSNFLIDKFQFKWVYVGLGGVLLLCLPGVYFLHHLPKRERDGSQEERERLLSRQTYVDSDGLLEAPSL